MQLKSVEVLNILGQSVLKFESNTHDTYITHKTKNMATGAYIIKLNTATGVISKKVLVQKNWCNSQIYIHLNLSFGKS